MHRVNKMFHIFRVHVGIDAMTEITYVVSVAELLQHVLGQFAEFFFVGVECTRIQVTLKGKRLATYTSSLIWFYGPIETDYFIVWLRELVQNEMSVFSKYDLLIRI